MPISVIPIWTVDRKRPGSAARSSAHLAPLLPPLAMAFSRASRDETIASSLIANTPLRAISARIRTTSSQGMGRRWSLMGGRRCLAVIRLRSTSGGTERGTTAHGWVGDTADLRG